MQVFQNIDEQIVFEKAVEALNNAFVNNSQSPILFLTSGGSALKLINELKINKLDNLIISVLDERFSMNPLINNFSQLTQTVFFQKNKEKGIKYINTQIKESETIELAAEHFENELKKWRLENPNGKIIATFGIGSDGHTSGIMPFRENNLQFQTLFETDSWVIGYDVREKNQYPERVTTTITFLINEIDEGIVYVIGKEKKEVIKKLLEKNSALNELPSMVFYKMKKVLLFTSLI